MKKLERTLLWKIIERDNFVFYLILAPRSKHYSERFVSDILRIYAYYVHLHVLKFFISA